jgi:addiction module RelE/StbE family toxin
MRLGWSRRALAELDRMCVAIARDKPAVAAGFTQSIADKVALLSDFPLLGKMGVYQDTRELVVHKNYLVSYRVRAVEVQVLQVWHTARNRQRGG